MSVSVENSPEEVCLAKNPVVYELESNNVFSSVGTTARHRMEITSLPTNGDTWNFKWLNDGIDLTFTFTTGSLGNSGLNLPIGGANANEFVDDYLLPALRNNYYINRDFTVYRNAGFTYWEAREAGTDYDISFTSGPQAWNNGFIQDRAGVDKASRDNFRIILELYLRYSGESVFKRLERNKVPFENKVLFNLSETLRSRNKFLLPEPDRLTVFDSEAQNTEFYVRYGEAFGDPLEVQKMTDGPVLKSIVGGLNLRDSRSVSFFNDLTDDFLTWNKAPKLREDQPYFLTWINATIYTGFWLMMDLFEQDGTLISQRLVLNFTLPINEQVTLPAHYTRATTGATLNGATVDHYDVYLQRAGTTQLVSSKIRVQIDRAPIPDIGYIAYRNNLGAIEYFAMRGEKEVMVSLQQKIAMLQERFDDDYSAIGDAVYNTRLVEKMTLYTGFLTKDESYAFIDLLSSEQRYLLVGAVYLPISLAENNYSIASTNSDENNSHSVTVSLREEENFSDAGNRIQ